jgi:signal transduction histidine kinase
MTKRIPSLGLHAQITTDIESDARIQLNVELFEWAIENLVKNALDALDTRSKDATIILKSYVVEDECIIDVTDTGKGIDKKFQKEIFKPGFSTKKRGWGLGLSLTKRIIEEYHKGEISIKQSEIDVGTTFCIVLPIVSKRKPPKTA